MELTNQQYIKAISELRKHGLSNGGALGYHAGWCDEVADLLENSLTLIKERTKENEDLHRQFQVLDIECCRLEKRDDELTKENERLKTICDMKQCVIENAEADIAKAKAGTVQKMQEMLKGKSEIVYGDRAVCVELIDETAKELLEGIK